MKKLSYIVSFGCIIFLIIANTTFAQPPGEVQLKWRKSWHIRNEPIAFRDELEYEIQGDNSYDRFSSAPGLASVTIVNLDVKFTTGTGGGADVDEETMYYKVGWGNHTVDIVRKRESVVESDWANRIDPIDGHIVQPTGGWLWRMNGNTLLPEEAYHPNGPGVSTVINNLDLTAPQQPVILWIGWRTGFFEVEPYYSNPHTSTDPVRLHQANFDGFAKARAADPVQP